MNEATANELGGLAVVVLEHTAEPFSIGDLRNWDDGRRRLLAVTVLLWRCASHKHVVVHSLMWPLLVIVLHELADDDVQVLLPEDDEVVVSSS